MKRKAGEYKHQRTSDFVKVEIRDSTYRVIYRNNFNIKDRNAIINFLSALEKYSGFSVLQLIKEKLKMDTWF